MADVIIVSCFGRGHWLANQWTSQGLDVTLVDVSDAIGHWAPEDWEGPFGVFRPEALESLQRARLMDDAYLVNVDNGFTVWTEQGVLELKGPLTQFRLGQLDVSQKCSQYINHFEALTPEDKRELVHSLSGEGFAKTWLAHLAHQLPSAVYSENAASLSFGRPLPLFAPWVLRRATRRGYEDSLKAYSRSGVRVLPQAQILDIDIVNQQVQGLEVRSVWSGIIRGNNLVWLLSGEESQRIHEKVHQLLFPQGAVLPEWCWLRYRVELEATGVTEVLPMAYVNIGDKHLPWAHANLICMQRTERDNVFEAWVRLPVHQRFQRQYLEQVGDEIVAQLSQRLPATAIRIVDMPQEHRYDYSEVGPSRFPIYEAGVRQGVKVLKGANVFFDGPEYWESLDWLGQLRSQARIESIIRQRWLSAQAQSVLAGSQLGD